MREYPFKTLPEILGAMRYGPIPKHRHDNDLLEFYADRIEEALQPLLSIDLSKVAPVPWVSRAYNVPIADTGDVYGSCDVVDADGRWVLQGDGDCPEEREVEIDNCFHDGDCVAAAACVNAIAELQRQFGKKEEK